MSKEAELILAAEKNDYKTALKLLNEGVSPNCKDNV